MGFFNSLLEVGFDDVTDNSVIELTASVIDGCRSGFRDG
jgi:hypothetical protein